MARFLVSVLMISAWWWALKQIFYESLACFDVLRLLVLVSNGNDPECPGSVLSVGVQPRLLQVPAAPFLVNRHHPHRFMVEVSCLNGLGIGRCVEHWNVTLGQVCQNSHQLGFALFFIELHISRPLRAESDAPCHLLIIPRRNSQVNAFNHLCSQAARQRTVSWSDCLIVSLSHIPHSPEALHPPLTTPARAPAATHRASSSRTGGRRRRWWRCGRGGGCGGASPRHAESDGRAGQ